MTDGIEQDPGTGPGAEVEQDTSAAQDKPILRLALAMRGGVSLAVWIGGAVAELDLLRRAVYEAPGRLAPAGPPVLGQAPSEAEQAAERERELRRRVYRDLLDLADLERVEIDVLAGASAGGLNAVLYGTALANGRRIDDMREVWANLAEFPSLLRQTAKRPGRFVPSLLRGDEYFYLRLRERLVDLATPTERPQAPAARYLTVALSATMLPKVNLRGVRELRERGASSGRASFSLSLRPTMGGPAATLSDIPTEATTDPGWRQFLVDRLALAGRATSSFPGGFEPARVHADETNPDPVAYYQRADDADEANEDVMSRYRRAPLMTMPNMVEVFSAARPTEPPESARLAFGVVDGGVFDNIAVGRALAAIANAPAEVHTHRWLVYLDPDPAKAPAPRFGSIRPPAFSVPRLMASLAGMRAASSTVRDDLEELQEHNERAQARRATTDAFGRQLATLARAAAAQGPGALRELGARLASPDATMGVYATYRAAADLPRLTRLLVRPQQTISGQVLRRKGFDPWSEESVGEVMVQLRQPLLAWYVRPGNDLHRDLTAVMDTADFLIAWIRALERWHYEGDPASAGPGWTADPGDRKRLKRVLYRVLFLATALRDLADHALLTTPMAATLADRVSTGLARVHATQAAYRVPEELDEYFNQGVDPVAGVRTGADSDPLFYDAVARYLAGDPARPDARMQAMASEYLWGRLTELFEAVRAQSPVLRPDTGGDEEDRPWRESIFHVLTAHPELVGGDLALLGPMFAGAGGLPNSTQMVSFDTFTADRMSLLYKGMPALRRAVRAGWARSMLRGQMPDVSRSWLDSRTKLAGNQLANFAGFLDRRWRNNDWMWGRADSAANTVSLLVKQVRLSYVDGGKPGVAAAARRLSDWAGVPVPATWSPAALDRLGHAVSEKLQRSVIDELIDERLEDLTTGQETPAVMPARRRSGLIMHVGLLVTRAMLPSPTGVRTFLIRTAAQAMRPFFVLALLLAMPARAVLMLGLVLAGVAVSDAGSSGGLPVRAGVLAGVALLGCFALGVRAAATNRKVADATAATGALREQAAARHLITADGEGTADEEQAARTASADLAVQAVAVLRRVHIGRWVTALVTLAVTGLAALGAAVAWARVGPWLAEGNWASFAGLVVAELALVYSAFRVSDLPLRERTGRRRPTRPWFVGLCATASVAGTVVAGHLPAIGEAVNRPFDDASLTSPAAAGGAAMLLALVAVSTFDWMRWRWLPVAWGSALLLYAGLLLVADWRGLPNTLFMAVLLAGVAYLASFTYVITVFCEARYPHDDREPAEPRDLPHTVRFG